MTPAPPRTHVAVRGFDRAAAAYERGRPGYPAAAIAHLARTLGLRRGATVVELGSGTGKFTRALSPTGATIVAVEPTDGMRRVFARTVPRVAVLDGTAESIPLPDGFADAVVAAQAFHWFRPRPALREITRVLRPGGGLGLVFNTRDESVGWSHRLSEIIAPYWPSGRRAREAQWRAPFERNAVGFTALATRAFPYAQRASPEEFVARVLSVSVIAILPPRERRRVAEQVRAVLAADPATRGRRSLDLPYRTDVYTGRRR